MANQEQILDLGERHNLPGFRVVLHTDPEPIQYNNGGIVRSTAQAYGVSRVMVPGGGVYESASGRGEDGSDTVDSFYGDSLALVALGLTFTRAGSILTGKSLKNGSLIASRMDTLRAGGRLRPKGIGTLPGLIDYAFGEGELLCVTKKIELEPGTTILDSLSEIRRADRRERALQVLRCAANDMTHGQTIKLLGLTIGEIKQAHRDLFQTMGVRKVRAAVMMGRLSGLDLELPADIRPS